MNKRILLASPHMSSEGYEREFVEDAFNKNWIAPLGENVDNFEKELAARVGAKYAAALSAGTAALHMALKAAGIKRGDTVICSSMTFSATANPVIYEGGKIVFVDSEAETWNMDPKALEKAFELHPEAKIVLLAHLYGTPAKMDEIVEICKKHNATLIEDAAESLGATYKDKETGTFGRFGIYSFNGNKIITTSGGGMLISDDEEAIKKVRFWSTQARDNAPWYQHSELGYNYRMSNICAGIGRGQLKVLNDRIAKKTEIYNNYKEGFAEIKEITMHPIPENTQPNHWLSTMLIDCEAEKVEEPAEKVMELAKVLNENNIETRPIWKPLHMQPFFIEGGCEFVKVAENAVCEDIFRHGICLPSDSKMTDAEQQKVIEVIKGQF